LFLVGNSIFQVNVKVSDSSYRSLDSVSREDWACVVLILLGIILFLVGANYYNSLVGWSGVFMFIVGILALIVLCVYHTLTKPAGQNAPQNA